MYFSGNVPLIVAGTSPAFASSGLGITVKLSAESGPSFEQDVMNSIVAADSKRRLFFCIICMKILIDISISVITHA